MGDGLLSEVLIRERQSNLVPGVGDVIDGRYELLRDTADADTFMFLEDWADREAHQAHMKTPHFQAARAAQEGLVATRNVRFLEKL